MPLAGNFGGRPWHWSERNLGPPAGFNQTEAATRALDEVFVGAIGETSAQLAVRDPDTRLMIAVRDDEPGAFESLVERYQARLVGVLHHLVGNAEEAEDLAQEVFLRVYRSRKRYRARCKFSTWMFTIANNLAFNARRARQRRPVVQLAASDSGPLGPRPVEQMLRDSSGNQPIRRLQRDELEGVIRQALDGLNERQRLAVLLNKFEDMGYAEIAEVMGLTSKGVKSLLCRARVNLREVLKAYVYMDGQPVPGGPDEEEKGT
jgi:RNA polymerase sigma-70 factor (ECF subfamily)